MQAGRVVVVLVDPDAPASSSCTGSCFRVPLAPAEGAGLPPGPPMLGIFVAYLLPIFGAAAKVFARSDRPISEMEMGRCVVLYAPILPTANADRGSTVSLSVHR